MISELMHEKLKSWLDRARSVISIKNSSIENLSGDLMMLVLDASKPKDMVSLLGTCSAVNSSEEVKARIFYEKNKIQQNKYIEDTHTFEAEQIINPHYKKNFEIEIQNYRTDYLNVKTMYLDCVSKLASSAGLNK